MPSQLEQQTQQQAAHPTFNPPHYHSSVGPQRPTANMLPTTTTNQQTGARADTPQALAQPQPQQSNGHKRLYAEFEAEFEHHHNEQPMKIQLPGYLSSPSTRQLNPHAEVRAQELAVAHAKRMNERGQNVPIPQSSAQVVPGASSLRSSNNTTTEHRPNWPKPTGEPIASYLKPINAVPAHTQIGPWQPPPPPKTSEQIQYEREMAEWKAQNAERQKQARIEEQQAQIEKERLAQLKVEIDAAMKVPGNNILAFRYRDYLKIYPVKDGSRLSTYHLNLLANQNIQDGNEHSEDASTLR